MNRSDKSGFELSPAEKRQLVEDLWDDLAATPESFECAEFRRHQQVGCIYRKAVHGAGLLHEKSSWWLRESSGRIVPAALPFPGQ